MGILNWLGIGKEIADPINAVSNLYTTEKEKLEGEKNLEEVIQKPILAQLENNRLLILSGKLFNSGWAPLIGWTSGFLILIYYAPQILIINYVWGIKCLKTGLISPYPMKPDDIFNLVWLLFGFGTHSLIQKKL